MSAVLSALGTILMVLLIVVLVLLGLVCFILFCPVCNKAEGEFGEKLLAGGRVSWLLGLVWVTFTLEDGVFTSKIRLLGIDLQKVSAWRKKRWKKKQAKKNAKKQIRGKTAQRKQSKEEEKQTKSVEKKSEIVKPKKSSNQIWVWWQKLKESVQKLKGFWKTLVLFRKKIKQKTDWAGVARKFWKSENTRGMVCIIKDNVIHLWRKLKPKVLRGSIIFGTGDPCSTGEILGIAAIFYAAYGRGIQVTPDFETARLEGKIFIKGRISLITIVVILLRILLSSEWSRFRRETEQLKEAF